MDAAVELLVIILGLVAAVLLLAGGVGVSDAYSVRRG
jgi:hypothetical protein